MNEIEAARRQALARIEAAGYRLGGGLAEDAFPARELYLDAWLANARVGTAHFSDHGAYAFCQNIEIAPDHQCKGLESAMYVLAEQMLDQTLKTNKKHEDPKGHTPASQCKSATSWSTALAAVAALRGLDRDGQLLELGAIRVRCWLNALQCCANNERIGTAYFLPVENLLRSRLSLQGDTRIPVTARQLERYSFGPSVPRIRKVQSVSALLPATDGIFESHLWEALKPEGQSDDTILRVSGEIISSMKVQPEWVLRFYEPSKTWSSEIAEKAVKDALLSTQEDRLAEILGRLDPLSAVGYSVCLFRIAVSEKGNRTRCATAVIQSILALEAVRWAKPLMVRMFDYFWWILAADESLSGTHLRAMYPSLRSDLTRRSLDGVPRKRDKQRPSKD